jgi:hypothetical protein
VPWSAPDTSETEVLGAQAGHGIPQRFRILWESPFRSFPPLHHDSAKFPCGDHISKGAVTSPAHEEGGEGNGDEQLHDLSRWRQSHLDGTSSRRAPRERFA